jgi:hypothetical protein
VNVRLDRFCTTYSWGTKRFVDNGSSDNSSARRATDLTQSIREFSANISALQPGDLTPAELAALRSLLDELKALRSAALTSTNSATQTSWHLRRR